eukprot:Em0017g220a
MLASLLFGCVAFLLAFVAKRDTGGLVYFGNTSTVAHFVIGITVMALHIANPIVSMFRCHPNEKHRWIFNILHGSSIGLCVEFLALANTGIGLSLFGNYLSQSSVSTLLALYLTYAAILLVGQLFLASAIKAVTISSPATPSMQQALITPSQSELNEFTNIETDDPTASKKTNADGNMRWTALILFLTAMLPLMLAVIVLLAVL